MSIICFEGASAVGKTTTAAALNTSLGAFVVPEVNELFNRPENISPEWYFERQIDRWSIAQEQSKYNSLVVLDGDVFQPLWYAWAYDFEGWQNLDFMERFYKPKIQNKMVGFPDLYFILSTNEVELMTRKVNDAGRRRRGFEKHLKMIEPQHRYFRAMHEFQPNRVLFIDTESIETNVEFIRQHISNLIQSKDESIDLFTKMIQWLRENKTRQIS
jgi:thymidylate kinase